MLSGSGSRQLLMFVFTLVLARILSPTDFAAVALVTAFVTVMEAVARVGISVALIQRADVTDELLDSTFVLSIPLFLIVSGLLVVFSGWIAEFFGMPVLGPLLNIGALTFFFRGLASFHQSLMMRDLDFGRVSWIQVISAMVFGVLAIVLARLGYGAFSVMWGYAGGALVAFLVSVALRPFWPKTLGSLREIKSLLRFGGWISLGRALGQVAYQADRMIIGRVLTESALGGYYLAHRLALGLPSLFAAAVDQVFLPIYASAKNDPATVERGYWKGVRFSAVLVVPMALGLAVFARPVVWLLLGEPWMYIVELIQFLSVVGAVQATGAGVFSSATYASDKPHLNSVASALRIVGLPLSVWIGSQWGIIVVAWGVTIFSVIGRLFNQWLLERYLGYSMWRYFQTLARPTIANGVLVVVGVMGAGQIALDGAVSVMLGLAGWGALTLLTYGVLCLLLVGEETRTIWDQGSRMLRSTTVRILGIGR